MNHTGVTSVTALMSPNQSTTLSPQKKCQYSAWSLIQTIARYLKVLETLAEASEMSAVAPVPFLLLEIVWMATEEGNQEWLMFEAVSTDPGLGGKYL